MSEININIEKVKNSCETIASLESCIATHNFHEYFYEIEDYISKINSKHDFCSKKYQNDINEINESIDKIKNKINLLSDSLRKTLNTNNETKDFSLEKSSSIKNYSQDMLQYKETNNSVTNNDSSKVVVPVPKPEVEKDNSLFPEGYDTTPIGLGIAGAGATAAIGAVVIDSLTPKSYKRNKDKKIYEIDDNNELDYRDYKIADEAEEKPIISLKIDPSMTSYQASRDKESMKKFYDDIDRQ